MSLVADKHLTLPAAALARAAPGLWREFVAGMRAYTDARRDEMVQASLEGLQKAQGRAQQCGIMSSLLDDAVKAADLAATKAAK